MAVQPAKSPIDLTPQRWARIEAAFHDALEREGGQRTAFLDEIGSTDPLLRSELERLLAVEDAARGFLASLTTEAMDSLGITASGPAVELAEFAGNQRFLLQRKLGSGGFGTVYETRDREHNAIVALKTLHRAGTSEIYRLKREFRSLVDITHPNLVSLYELLSDGEHWFFTMELVDGTDFLSYARPDGSQCDWTRLRATLAQLAAGVCALHDSGRLHRDLKPSNVLVSTEGRVVIVDFGMIADSEVEELRGPIAGTPAYMAPEQLETGRASAATDWYSVGMMLFQVLTGRLPFSREIPQLLAEKRTPLAPPSHFDPRIPHDLDELCQALLRLNAWERPGGREILRLLDAADPAGWAVLPEGPLVGREQELDSLHHALGMVSDGTTTVACVAGKSGMGKTVLVHHFLNQVRRDGRFLVLSGRCYEQESVPYKGLDEVADALAVYLQRLSRDDVMAVMDSSVALAARLFPVLQAFTPSVQYNKIDTQEVQQAAFAAFRSLLRRLSERCPLVIHIDDLQWSNADSLHLLTEILRAPGSPVALLIVSFRSEAEQDSGTVDPVAAWQANVATLCHTMHVAVGQLAPDEADKLASLLAPEMPDRAKWVARAAQESRGNPLLLSELAEHARSSGINARSGVSVEEMLQSRVALLPEDARQLLEVVAISGQPLETQIAWRAARYEEARQSALGILRAHRLIRVRRVRDRQEIETYHDRVRESVEAALAPDIRIQLHLRLAEELEASGDASPDALAVHFHEGRQNQKAFQYSIRAAEAASRALAFERASHWYRLALSEREDREVRVRLADSLSSSGRGSEAAELYLLCSENVTQREAVDLRRRAATELLISGHIAEGLKLLEQVLRGVGINPPRTARRAIPSLLLNRVRIALRGLELGQRRSGEIDADAFDRVDACWSVTRGFAMVDTIRAAEFHSRNLLLTLSLGDTYRAARALFVEAGYQALSGGKGEARRQRIMRMAGEQERSCGDPHALGLEKLVAGMAAFLGGRWSSARDSLQDAEEFLRERCAGVAWELATARFMHCACLYFLGEIKNLSLRLPVLLENARSRGDLYESTDLKIRIAHVRHLAYDQPDVAGAELREAVAQRPQVEFYLQHWWAMIAGVEIAIYRGDTEGAWTLVNSKWVALRRSLLMGIQYIRIESYVNRALAALAFASSAPQRKDQLLRSAVADAARIEREKVMWAQPFGDLIRGRAATLRGEPEAALHHMASAETGFSRAGMQMLVAASRRRRGQLISGDEGRDLVANADARMKAQDILNPERLAGMLAP